MKVKHTRWFPPGNFAGIMIFGTLYVKGKNTMSKKFINHEEIHCAQAVDCGGWWQFYTLYIGYWIRNLFLHFNTAYNAIPFEREAYINAADLAYLNLRQHGAWRNYTDKNLKRK